MLRSFHFSCEGYLIDLIFRESKVNRRSKKTLKSFSSLLWRDWLKRRLKDLNLHFCVGLAGLFWMYALLWIGMEALHTRE